jgi:hypothetical protein
MEDEIFLLSQIYISSKICANKFSYYKRGLILTLIAFIAFAIMMMIGASTTI